MLYKKLSIVHLIGRKIVYGLQRINCGISSLQERNHFIIVLSITVLILSAIVTMKRLKAPSTGNYNDKAKNESIIDDVSLRFIIFLS